MTTIKSPQPPQDGAASSASRSTSPVRRGYIGMLASYHEGTIA